MRGQSATGAKVTNAVERRRTVPEFLTLAIDLAWALDDWHRRSGPHTALSPDTVHIAADGTVSLIAPHTAAVPCRPGADGAQTLAGDPLAGETLVSEHGCGSGQNWHPEYTAPEQTGHLGRGADERTDLYAVGVLYYQWLTGRLPFEADSLDEWHVYHLTRHPTPPADLVPDLPSVLSEVVELLLAKSPDERYQTARGLALDLERCREMLTTATGHAPLLRLHDVPDRLMLTGRVYGRERSLTRLQAAYDKAATEGSAQLVAVTADAGLGKWALVAEFTDRVVTDGGCVARAFCVPDEPAPYAPVARLVADLTNQLANTPVQVREKVADAVGGCGATLADLVPAIGPVLGHPTAPPPGTILAARHRLHLAVRRLFGALGAPGRPLVIAIRDLHWADESVISLLRYVLAAPDAPPVLMLVTYRPAEVRARHPIKGLMSDSTIPSASVALRPLPDSALSVLMADTLRASMRESSRLARAVAARTGSNPLLVEQFLHSLAERDLLICSDEGPAWQWHQRQVEDEPSIRDIAALLTARLDRLPPSTRGLLDLAAMLGPTFFLDTLAAADTGAAPDQAARDRTAARLRPAIQAELVGAGVAPDEYQWRHEDIRQAVLEVVPEADLAAARPAAGRALAAIPGGERLFDAVEQLNQAVELLHSPDETRWLAELNLAAGRRAAALGAGDTAREYLAMGLDLLDPDAWQQRYELALALHVESADVERTMGDIDRAEHLLTRASGVAGDNVDQALVLGMRAMLQYDRRDRVGAYRLGIEALGRLGVNLPAEPEHWPAALAERVARLRVRLTGAPPDKLAVAVAPAPRWVTVAADLIVNLAYPTWPIDVGRDLLVAAGVELALDHAPAPATAFILMRMANLYARERDDESVRRCIRISQRLLDTVPASRHPAAVRAIAAAVAPSGSEAPQAITRELYATYLAAVEEGEVTEAQHIAAVHAVHRLSIGAPLDRIVADIEEYWRFSQRHGPEEPAGAMVRVLDEAVSRLRGLPYAVPATGGRDTVDRRLRRGEFGYYSVVGLAPRLSAAYLLGELDEAGEVAQVMDAAAQHAPRGYLTAESAFFQGLTLIARYESANAARRRALADEIDSRQAELDDLATRGPGIFGARALVLSAERARLVGDVEQARTRFDRAIGAAHEAGMLGLEGLAAELAGRYALSRGESIEAVAYLRRARTCYQQWGAVAKLAQVDQLLAHATPPTGDERAPDQLDLFTVVRAFQAISAELRLDRLIKVLLELIVQHSQAERGCLVLGAGSQRRVAGEAVAEPEQIMVTVDPPGDPADLVPLEIVGHAEQTRETVSGTRGELSEFGADPYLARHLPRSLLCAPIIRDGAVVAMLYLEHRRMSAPFTSSYLELLDVLCAQAAIALENARVHARLMDANRVLDAAFDQLPAGLILLGPDLRVRRASPRARRVTGLPLTPGTPLMELFEVLTPVDMQARAYRSEPRLAEVAEPPTEPIENEVVIVAPSGDRVRLATSTIPLRDEAGNLVGVTLLVSPA